MTQAREAEECRMDFEEEEGLLQQTVTICNASYLRNQSYQKTMSEWCHGEWILLEGGQRRRFYRWSDILLLSLGLLGLMLCAVIGWQVSYEIWQSGCFQQPELSSAYNRCSHSIPWPFKVVCTLRAHMDNGDE